MAEWHFRPLQLGVTVREPIQAEFFSAEAIGDPGVALVREGIQNSLDAGRPGEKVLVRIFLSEKGPSAEQVAPYVSGLRAHLTAEGAGLREEDIPPPGVSCPFLAFEDFGTTGLEGDPAEAFRSKTGRKNHFYHFFRAEGQSDKESSDRGVWGVGKHVFARSSKISSIFGLTVRAEDGRRLLMGRVVLKSHYVGDKYYQDGYFGLPPSNGQPLVMPVETEGTLDDFARIFDLQRGREPGLSVVVPWPHTDITDESLVRAVLQGYFYPILAGQLEVCIETPGVKALLDAESLVPETRKIGNEFARRLLPVLELADWARRLPDEQKHQLKMPDPDHAWQWSADLFSPEQLKSLRQAFERGEKAAIRVPVTVRPKGGASASSYFDLFMARDRLDRSGRPTFVREGIIVPRVDAPRTRGVRALVVIDDVPLAAFLRDAENPAHTEWQHDGSHFRGKYKSGRSDLAFIKRSVHEIVRILGEAEKKEDPTLLIDFFSLPASPEDQAVPSQADNPGDKEGKQPPQPRPPRATPPPVFRVNKVKGGFSVTSTKQKCHPPLLLVIEVAYDVRRGNPLKRYSVADFRLQEPPIVLEPEPEGVEVIESRDNCILARVTEETFGLHVRGFDERRDLYVRVSPKEAEDAS